MKKIIILGSTGSIGSQTLDVVRAYPGEFQVIGLSAHENTQLFQRQVREFAPKYIVQTAVTENPRQALCSLAVSADADIVVNALAGTVGVVPTIAACKAGKTIALANKESLVMAGELITELCPKFGARILPIDSEPSALWQMLDGADMASVEKVILTCSGGPFWKWKREELKRVTAAQAIKHPTWSMGEKISVDSATLMNKAFEIIETKWLLGLPESRIDITIHRQSIVHALVQFYSGSSQAVLSMPDMKIPIAQALLHPKALPNSFPRIDFSHLQLTFEKPDYSIFEGPQLAYEMLKAGGIMPAVFCLADEVAVGKFLAGEISFLEIYDVIKRAVDAARNAPLSLEALQDFL